MARITIEDCIEKVPNRFHLVAMTAIRAKQLKKGANSLVQNEDNKEVVVALREVAAGMVKPDFSPPPSADEPEFLPGLEEDGLSSEPAPLEASASEEAATEPTED